MNFRLSLVALGCLALVIGCASRVTPKPDAVAFKHECTLPSRLLNPPPPKDAGRAAPERPPAGSGYSEPAWRAARLLGVTGLLEHMARLRAAGRTATFDYLLLRQRLSDRIMLGLLETSGTVAEITCERDRADQVADRMDEIDTTRVKGLTLASILFGGIGSIVSGGIALAGGASVASNIAEVTSGTLTSSFGAQGLFVRSEHEFQHPRNLLAEVWADPPATQMYPPVIWHFLHQNTEDSAQTVREDLIKAWQQEGRLGDAGSAEAERRSGLMFGPGGIYTASDLRARASMLETLEAKVRLIDEYVEALVREMAAADAS